MTQMTESCISHQVFVSFRGTDLRENFLGYLKSEFAKNKINFYVDENEIRGIPITTLFERIRESSVALIFFSVRYPESTWCLDELVEINKQMAKRSIVAIPVFYKLKSENVKKPTGSFGNYLVNTEEKVRKKVDRSSIKSILETEAKIWGWRQALLSVGRNMGIPYKHINDTAFVIHIVVEVMKLVDYISSPRNNLIVMAKPQEAVTLLLQALNLNQSDLEDLITQPYNHINCAIKSSNDHLVFLDLISLKNPCLAQRLVEPGKIFLVLLGSLEVNKVNFLNLSSFFFEIVISS